MTVCTCDCCGLVEATDEANGVAVEGWGSGHLWLDVSLAEQRQTPLCFCPACNPGILSAPVLRVKPEAE
ncbi:hypothetical protein Q0601_00900 [Paracoccus onubensis]|uniref:hypothetical protein n=1 Tax=Paracoccus onubensis TaxID=1675788 RepID=UPI00273095A9|nr:hypothetical protein [Paracoccus onubensis]MDP0925720.1 hypothetical protein [Paracoccus onubensis]